MISISKFLRSTPQHIPLEEFRYYRLVRVVIGLALINHALWGAFFFVIDIKELFYIQFLSLSIFSVAFYLNQRRKYFASITLGTYEVIAHQILCVALIGPESGFQYYLLLSSMVPFLLPPGKLLIKSVLLLSNLIGFLVIYFIVAEKIPIYELGTEVDLWLGFTNISLTFVFLGFFGMHLTKATDDTEDKLNVEREKSDSLLNNILPEHVADELKATGKATTKKYDNVSILFTDFQDFTKLVASIPATELVEELNDIFGRFDDIMDEFEIEKIETIGDAYMAACGLTEENSNHALKCVEAAQRMISFLNARNKESKIQWNMRVGIHSGPVVAGVVGKKKYAYDLFGDTVNTASRIESNGEAGKINISETTYRILKHNPKFTFEHRGQISAKGKGELGMWFVNINQDHESFI